MAIRSRRLFGPVLLTGATTQYYAVPMGRTLQVNTLWFVNADAVNAGIVTLYIGGGGTSNRALKVLVPGDGGAQVNGRMVLNPGDTFWAVRSAGVITMVAAGVLLLGEPE